jgi:thioredoxin 1
LKKVTLIIAKQCPKCPMAKIFWRELREEHGFDYEEIDSMTEKAQKYIQDLSIMSVPTAIVEDNGRCSMTFFGTPSKSKVLEAIEG